MRRREAVRGGHGEEDGDTWMSEADADAEKDTWSWADERCMRGECAGARHVEAEAKGDG